MARIDDLGGMYAACEAGVVQRMIGESAQAWQERVESGEEKIIGVNCYESDADEAPIVETSRPDPERMRAHVESLKTFKRDRSQSAAKTAITQLRRAANNEHQNTFEQVIDAADAGATHGEIIACLREELGFGDPLIVA